MPGETLMLREFRKLKKEFGKLRKKSKKVEHRLEFTIVTALSAALAFVIALSWNDTIRSATDTLFRSLGLVDANILYRVLKSVVITISCVLGIYLLSKLE